MRTILLLAVALFIVSCNKNDDYYKEEIFNNQNQKIYGSWQLLHSSVIGKKSVAINDPNNVFHEKLEISRIGKYKMLDGNILRETGRLIVREQTDNTLKIRFFPDDIYQNNYLPNENYVEFFGSDTINLEYVNFDQTIGIYKRIK